MREILKNLNELVMFSHTIFSIPFIIISMIVSANGWFGWSLLFLGLFAAVTARNFAMGINRFLDRDIDLKNPRTANRPSVDGRVGKNTIIFFVGINAFLFILVSYFINNLAFILSFPFLLIIGGYSLVKRFSSLAHLVLGLSLALAPIAGVIAVLGEITTWSIYLASGVMFWVAGFDLLYSLQDMEFDKKEGLHSIPVKFGYKNTLLISFCFHLLTVVFWYCFILKAGLGLFSYLGLFIAISLLAYEHYLINSGGLKNINKAFFTANGYLGILFLVCIILEYLWM